MFLLAAQGFRTLLRLIEHLFLIVKGKVTFFKLSLFYVSGWSDLNSSRVLTWWFLDIVH